tara:strand:- start:3614 stop:3817 length:204 start_codon:yes stop_codon:yes gene_type:complete
MRLEHNQISLTLPDGRSVSIIQNQKDGQGNAHGHYGYSVEIWIEDEPEPMYHLDFEQAMKYIMENVG